MSIALLTPEVITSATTPEPVVAPKSKTKTLVSSPRIVGEVTPSTVRLIEAWDALVEACIGAGMNAEVAERAAGFELGLDLGEDPRGRPAHVPLDILVGVDNPDVLLIVESKYRRKATQTADGDIVLVA